MWTRKELKLRAKEVLRKNYWKAFLISIVIAIAECNGGSGGGGGSNRSAETLPSVLTDEVFLIILGIVVIIVIILIAAFRIFLGYPLEVGGRSFFIKSAQNEDHKKSFGFAFSGQNYLGIVGTMLRRGVQIILWFLLLIIPGIIKSYAYRMVPYILADNPNIGSKEAIKLSNQMTSGHKFNMFVLDISFIGWYLLGILALIVGVLFVLPYVNATDAELYLTLRKNALENGFCTSHDLLLDVD